WHAAAAREEELTRLPCRGSDVIIHRLAGLLCQFEPTGCPVFRCRTVARSMVMPCGAISSTFSPTTSQPRSLLSIARLNIARSRLRAATWSWSGSTIRPWSLAEAWSRQVSPYSKTLGAALLRCIHVRLLCCRGGKHRGAGSAFGLIQPLLAFARPGVSRDLTHQRHEFVA